jgi:hypothetical protein
MSKTVAFVRRRLGERSTWTGIVLAVTGAAIVPEPYSWLALAAGVIGAIVPDGPVGAA